MPEAAAEQRLVLFGAFDRFNYGDLLYPIVVKHLIGRRAGPIQIEVCSTTASNMSGLGADPTVQLSAPVLDDAASHATTVLVAGGEVLSQNWFGTLLASLDSESAGELIRLQSTAGAAHAEQYAKNLLSDVRRFPWLIEPAYLPANWKVAYNSVGGWPLGMARATAQRDSARVLEQAAFLSVRDGRTWEILKTIWPSLPVRLAPDIISLVARVWPKKELDMPLGLPDLAPILSGRYICVQANAGYLLPNLQGFAQQISSLAAYLDAGIVLVPFGRCRGWNDIDGLVVLQERLGSRAVLLGADSSIRDVTAVAAGAALFVGTSLHGVVVSAAYGVPAVALATPDPKVQNYLRTWPVAGSVCVSVEELSDAARAAIREQDERMLVQVEMERMALENFHDFSDQLKSKSRGY
ncbi:MAG: polysaccharide pyruvyl transferase family protein [Acidobacteriota bacterium]